MPLLPELFVRTRRADVAGGGEEGLEFASEDAGGVAIALQLVRDEDCFWCASTACCGCIWLPCVRVRVDMLQR